MAESNTTRKRKALSENEQEIDSESEEIDPACSESEEIDSNTNKRPTELVSPLKVTKGTIRVPDDICEIIHSKNKVCFTGKMDLDSLKERGIEVRTGKWIKEEDEMLKQNWETFLKYHPIEEPLRLLNTRKDGFDQQNRKSLRRFIKANDFYIELSRNLNRSTGSCYMRANKIFISSRAGPMSKEEINQIKAFRELYGNKWSEIGKKLERSGQSVNDKWRRIESEFNKGKWSEEEIGHLKNSILKVTKKKNLTEVPFANLPWEEIAKGVPKRNAEQCRSQWLYGFGKSRDLPDGKQCWDISENYKLIEKIYSLDIEQESEIDWEELYEEFSNLPSPHDLRRRWNMIKQSVSNSQTMTFNEVRSKAFCQIVNKHEAKNGTTK